jgi:hypothetical protein
MDTISERRSFSQLPYEGEDVDNRVPRGGYRPVWDITRGNANVDDGEELLSLGRDCLVEYAGIDWSNIDVSSNELIIRFEFEYYNGTSDSSDAGLSLTVDNPGTGWAGSPESGYNIYFGGGSSIWIKEYTDGSDTTLVTGSWSPTTDPTVVEVIISEENDNLIFEYIHQGTNHGTGTSGGFELIDIESMHWGNENTSSADSNPAGINWLEVFVR